MEKKKMKAIPVNEETWRELNRIKAIKGVPVVKLIEFSVPLLRRKYRIKTESADEREKL